MSELKLGGSSRQCDWVTKEQIKTLDPKSVVDFGAGRGKYCRFVRDLLGSDVRITAVEGYQPAADSLEKSGLCDRVDNVLLQRWFDDNNEKYDLAIFGDVLEHLSPRIINNVIRKSFLIFKWVIVVLPLYDIFQRDDFGNKLEIHRAYIGPDFFDKFHPMEKHIIARDRFGTGYDIMNVLLSADFRETRKPIKKAFWLARHYLLITLQHIGLAKAFVDFENYIRG